MTTNSSQYLADLQEAITHSFSPEEVRTLCLTLGVDFDNVPWETDGALIQELILQLARSDRLSELIRLLRQERPQLDWDDVPPDFALPESPATIDFTEPDSVGSELPEANGPRIGEGSDDAIGMLEDGLPATGGDSIGEDKDFPSKPVGADNITVDGISDSVKIHIGSDSGAVFTGPPMPVPPIVAPPTPAPISNRQMRLDAAMPEHVAVNVPFDLAVAVRLRDSTLLQVDDLEHVRSGELMIEWPEDGRPVDLRAYVHAPDCRIDGLPYQVFRLHSGHDSPVVYFSLTPLHAGVIPIRVTVYQSLLSLGTARLKAQAGERVAGSVGTIVSSGDIGLPDAAEEAIASQELSNFLVRAFSLDELQSLCFELAIDFDDVPGTTRQNKAQELVAYCRRHNRTEELVDHVIAARPNWLELVGEVG